MGYPVRPPLPRHRAFPSAPSGYPGTMDDPRDEPLLPAPRGPLSRAVTRYLRGAGALPSDAEVAAAPVYGEDLQLALYLCYELHYRGFADVAPTLEWDRTCWDRAAMERRFLAALREDAPRYDSVDDALAGILVEPVDGTGVSHFLRDRGGAGSCASTRRCAPSTA
ncbi:hypothetical protein SALBM217S_00582 [Streptomyces griseoloalbus]